MKVFDFRCDNGHVHELFVSNAAESVIRYCADCQLPLYRLPAAPQCRLEGITGSFPGAYSAWEKKRAEKQAIQARKERDHGDSGWT